MGILGKIKKNSRGFWNVALAWSDKYLQERLNSNNKLRLEEKG